MISSFVDLVASTCLCSPVSMLWSLSVSIAIVSTTLLLRSQQLLKKLLAIDIVVGHCLLLGHQNSLEVVRYMQRGCGRWRSKGK
jgi:hypothetical protein